MRDSSTKSESSRLDDEKRNEKANMSHSQTVPLMLNNGTVEQVLRKSSAAECEKEGCSSVDNRRSNLDPERPVIEQNEEKDTAWDDSEDSGQELKKAVGRKRFFFIARVDIVSGP